jgi:hypothetical protein
MRVLTKDDLGKCDDDMDIVVKPLYVMEESLYKKVPFNIAEYDDVDDLLWEIPQSDC